MFYRSKMSIWNKKEAQDTSRNKVRYKNESERTWKKRWMKGREPDCENSMNYAKKYI